MKPTWDIPRDNHWLIAIDGILHATTHVGAPSDPTAFPRLVTTRLNFARVSRNLNSISVEDARRIPLVITMDFTVLCRKELAEALSKDETHPGAVASIVASVARLSELCIDTAWTFHVILDAASDAKNIVDVCSRAMPASTRHQFTLDETSSAPVKRMQLASHSKTLFRGFFFAPTLLQSPSPLVRP